MTTLEESLALTPDGDGGLRAAADPAYQAGVGAYGGWIAALLLKAVEGEAPSELRTSALSVSYVNAVPPGSDLVVRPTRLGGSRSVEHWQVDLDTVGPDGEVTTATHATVVLTNRRDTDGRTDPVMPDVPAPEGLEIFQPPGTHGQREEHRHAYGFPPFNRPDTRCTSWLRETSGRPLDAVQLAYLCDATPPRSFFWSEEPRLSATLILSLHVLATPDELTAVGDDFVLLDAVGTRGTDSTSGQQVALWSRAGGLLATSEQLCWYR